MPRIAIIVDHPRRDLAGLVLTAFTLCQEGVTCHLVPLNLQERELWALAPDFVLLNFARRSTERLASQLSETGIKFGVLDTEGGVWGSPQEYSELLWADRSLLHKVDPVCAWGPAIADHIVKEGFFDKSRVTVTGCPRFDLYHPAWHRVLRGDDAGELGERYPKRILINTNFSFSNPRFSTVETHIKQAQQDFHWQLKRIMKMLRSGTEGMSAFVDLAQNLGRDFPTSEIVLRPHPFELDEYYRTRLAGLKNVIVDGEGPIQTQIYRADVVIQRSCSTAIESGIASVPTISPQWVPAEMEMPAAESVSIPCTTYEKLKLTLKDILNGNYKLPTEIRNSIERVIGTWFYRADGLAHRRVSETIRSCLGSAREVDERRCAKFVYQLSTDYPKNLSYLGSSIRYGLGLSPDWSFRQMRNVPSLAWTKTNKLFDVAEVRGLTTRMQTASQVGGFTLRPVEVELARVRGDYLLNYCGHSITLSC
ncbi:MAG TPA: surface carbohydrate biosynthesis protein [Pyrinomonadaceae bacterium]|nr:surface carbohydrate biosynthesis protein [Pyrinomonadaceae bacterium]